MWSGWLSAFFWFAFITVIFIGEKIDEDVPEHEDWAWYQVFFFAWIGFLALLISSCGPLGRHAAGCSSIAEAQRLDLLQHDDTDEYEDRHYYSADDVKLARLALQKECGMIAYSLFVTLLLLTSLILLSVQLDSVPDEPLWTWVFVTLITALVIIFLYFVVSSIFRFCSAPDEEPYWARTAYLFVCCRHGRIVQGSAQETTVDAQGRVHYSHPLIEYDEDVPLCLGGYRAHNLFAVAYNGALLLLLLNVIISAGLLLGYLNSNDPDTLTLVFLPAWIGGGLVVLASLPAMFVEATSPEGRLYETALLLLFDVFLVLIGIFLALLPLPIGDPDFMPHTYLIPLYLAFGGSALLFCCIEVRKLYARPPVRVKPAQRTGMSRGKIQTQWVNVKKSDDEQ